MTYNSTLEIPTPRISYNNKLKKVQISLHSRCLNKPLSLFIILEIGDLQTEFKKETKKTENHIGENLILYIFKIGDIRDQFFFIVLCL